MNGESVALHRRDTDRGSVRKDHEVVTLPGANRELGARELHCLALVAMGHSDHEIAAAAGISLSAARYAIRCALAKLGAVNRPHAVARATALGMLELQSVT